ncbi:hypothetical protein DL764_010211 [Monosporascus ibericus]|uniref:Reverse transcriptase Ty1/copia-type domain-containing protein n=1 Tax=Monosporascus ibericus TaxID=155417 RepID=A0A4Q4SVW0_9PEZI|nr:hypothetical protein DL764_010211 [Monosporascus ibericus]
MKGIKLVISSPHNQYQNGVAEKGIQFLQDKARATSAQIKIPTCFWDFVMEVITHTINRTGQSTGVKVKNKDHNVVSEDDTDKETKKVKRKKGRPKKTVPKLYTLEAPDEAPELIRKLKLALTQEGDDYGLHTFHFSPSSNDENFFGSSGNAERAIRNAYEYQQMVNMLKDKYDGIFEDSENINLALAAYLGWHILQIDFIAAYLNGNLKEDIYMKQFPMLKKYFDTYPEDRQKYQFSPKKVIKLMNPLYGLKQAGTAWQERIKKILAKLGFHPLISDDAIYFNLETGNVIASYVNDFLLFGADRQYLKSVAKEIAENVPIKDLGNADWYLGVRIVRSSSTGDVRLDQQQYIEKSLNVCNVNLG